MSMQITPVANRALSQWARPGAAVSGEPQDRFLGAVNVLTRQGESEPVELSEVAVMSHQGKPQHDLEEVYRLPDGRTVLHFRSFASRDRDKDPGGYSVALDASGKTLWEYAPEDGYSVETHLFLHDRTYVLSKGEGSWDGSRVVALDAQGKEMWRFESEDRTFIDSMQSDPSGNLTLKLGDDVVRLDPQGKQAWKKHLKIHSDEYFHVVTPEGGHVFANDNFCNNFGYDSFNLVTDQGKVKELDLPDIGSFPLVQGNMLYYAGEKGEARGIDLHSFEGWEVQTEARGLFTPFAGPDGRVYFTGRYDDKNLYCVSPDGKLLWQKEVDAAPAFGADTPFQPDAKGVVHFPSRSGDEILRIGPAGEDLAPIQVRDGFESFKLGPDGFVYSIDRNATIRRHDPRDGTAFELRLKLDESVRYELVEVEAGGIVAFQDGLSGIYHRVRVNPQDEVDRIQREIEKTAPTHSPGIREEEKWVVVGTVRVKKKGY